MAVDSVRLRSLLLFEEWMESEEERIGDGWVSDGEGDYSFAHSTGRFAAL